MRQFKLFSLFRFSLASSLLAFRFAFASMAMAVTVGFYAGNL